MVQFQRFVAAGIDVTLRTTVPWWPSPVNRASAKMSHQLELNHLWDKTTEQCSFVISAGVMNSEPWTEDERWTSNGWTFVARISEDLETNDGRTWTCTFLLYMQCNAMSSVGMKFKWSRKKPYWPMTKIKQQRQWFGTDSMDDEFYKQVWKIIESKWLYAMMPTIMYFARSMSRRHLNPIVTTNFPAAMTLNVIAVCISCVLICYNERHGIINCCEDVICADLYLHECLIFRHTFHKLTWKLANGNTQCFI